jgi:hypothetical protein
MRAVSEPITMLILGAGLVGLGTFARKTLSNRQLNMSTHFK